MPVKDRGAISLPRQDSETVPECLHTAGVTVQSHVVSPGEATAANGSLASSSKTREILAQGLKRISGGCRQRILTEVSLNTGMRHSYRLSKADTGVWVPHATTVPVRDGRDGLVHVGIGEHAPFRGLGT